MSYRHSGIVDFQFQISDWASVCRSSLCKSKIGNRKSKIQMGWPTGLEPATTRTTIWGSTIELRPPTVTRNKILRFESPFANPVSVGCQFGRRPFSTFDVGRGKGQWGRLTFLKQRTRLSQVTPLILDAGGTKICLQLDCRLG